MSAGWNQYEAALLSGFPFSCGSVADLPPLLQISKVSQPEGRAGDSGQGRSVFP